MKRSSHPHKRFQSHDPSSWKLVYERFNPAQEGLRESLCALGNGYLGLRGAMPGSTASKIHYPGMYIAGIYNKLSTHIARKTIWNEDLINCPNWLILTFKIGKGEWILPSACKILTFRQELDIRHGILSRMIRLRDEKGRITLIEQEIIVHIADFHRSAMRYRITPENYSGLITIRSGLDGSVQNTGVKRYRQLSAKHLRPVSSGSIGTSGIYLSVRTNHSGIKISLASRLRLYVNDKEIKPLARHIKRGKEAIYQECKLKIKQKQTYDFEKVVSIYTSHDKGVKNPQNSAVKSIRTAPGFRALLVTHRQTWEFLWRRFDFRIEGDYFAQHVLRLHIFHLLQTATIHNVNIDAGFPARGLSGESYRGHIFWDELFVMPLFDLHMPKVSKALLMYRYRRLPQARLYAKRNGYRGSMFPWQSGSVGDEETQVLHLNPLSGKWGADYSRIQRHISFTIAYNVWRLWERTGDLEFFAGYGAEILLSIAQFGASLCTYDPEDKRYHTDGLMGPDEFHEKMPEATKPGYRDNAYTNVLIVWTLRKAHQALNVLPRQAKARIFKKLKLDQKELRRWDDITRKMNIIINEDGIISQFDGYFGLKELDLEAYRRKHTNIERMDRILKSEGKSPSAYKIAKQADVLMMFYLLSFSEIKEIMKRLGYSMNKDMLDKNYDYYIKRTSHGSTLSKVVHCYVAHILGRTAEAWKWFLEVLKSDIYDTQGGTAPEGIHAGVMGGSITIALRGFAGIRILHDRIRIDPRLPAGWKGIQFNLRCTGSPMSFTLTRTHVTIIVYGPEGQQYVTPIEVGGRLRYLEFGKTYEIPITGSPRK